MKVASREDIAREVNAAVVRVLAARTAHEAAVAYLTRMQITLELAEESS